MHAFLAPDNFLGWAIGDVVALCAVVVLSLALSHSPRALSLVARAASVVARQSQLLITSLLMFAPVALRLLLLRLHPPPVPSGADDFGYLLLADTLRHGRMANVSPAFAEFFEQLFTLTGPVRASMFPLGQGIALAGGSLLTGFPWAGVLITGALFAGAMYWMLRGVLTPAWALAGVLLGICQFGPLCYWTNCYWGGFVSGIAGCLVFGAWPRLRVEQNWSASLSLGLGLALQLLTRQYESLLLLLCAAMFALAFRSAHLWRSVAPKTLLCVVPAVLLLGWQNHTITGRWTQLPYMLYRYNYGVPATFTFQSNPVPHRQLNDEQQRDYLAESSVHGDAPETLTRFVRRMLDRVRFYRFFLSAPLVCAYFWAVLRTRDIFWRCSVAAIAIFVFGTNLYPYFYPHYSAATSCLFLALAAAGLQRMPRPAATAILAVCFAQFATFYLYATTHVNLPSSYESWDYLNGGDPEGRLTVATELQHQVGRQIVFVHETPANGFATWVQNEADLTTSQVIWAHDQGDLRNRELLQTMPERKAWLLQPDETPPQLLPYRPSASPFEDVR